MDRMNDSLAGNLSPSLTTPHRTPVAVSHEPYAHSLECASQARKLWKLQALRRASNWICYLEICNASAMAEPPAGLAQSDAKAKYISLG